MQHQGRTLEHTPVAEAVILQRCLNTGESFLQARRAITTGEQLSALSPQQVLQSPTPLTVQRDHDEHVLLEPDYWQYTNHSCEPNLYFDIDAGRVLALREIAAGEQLTFFYPSTEWRMHRPFVCLCGSHRCLGTITGAAALPSAILAMYSLSGYIKDRTGL